MNFHPIQRRFARLAIIALFVVAISRASSDTLPTPRLNIRESAGSLFLDYYPGFSSTGAAMLHFSSDLLTLRSDTPASLFDISASTLGPLTFYVGSYRSGASGFFSITEFPGRTTADFATDEPEAVEPTPTYLVQSTTAISYPLTANQAVAVAFQLLDAATSDPATVNGTVSFRLVDAAGDPVAFAYTLLPASLTLVNGAVSGSITVQSAADLSNAFLAIDAVSASAGLRALVAPQANAAATSPGTAVGILTPPLSAYQQPTGSWRHPFHGTHYAISGNYGEWRPNKKKTPAGAVHEGLDFAAPVNTNVYPIAGGVVARVSDVDDRGAQFQGKLVVINHGNGYATRYLHINPKVKEDQIVTTDTPIGTVGTWTEVAIHLHLEMRKACAVYSGKNSSASPLMPHSTLVNIPVMARTTIL